MQHSAIFLLIGLALVCAGCSSKSSSDGASTSDKTTEKYNKKSDGKNADSTKKANPLVGKWTVTKSNKDWAENVSKQAVIEFLNDGETMTITNNNKVTAEANYSWQGKGFVFQAKFMRPDGNRNGYGAQVNVETINDQEIVADIFTLKRLK